MPADWVTCVAIQFLKENRCHELWHVHRCKSTRTCDENCLRGTWEIIEKSSNNR